MKPLEGLIVLEFSQYMSGPSAGLRLADMGARVIKIERPEKGEGGRKIAIKNLFSGEDSIVFHTINRNKESYVADLKNQDDLKKIKKLITKADVLTHNFRPGTMEKFGLDYNSTKKINSQLVYGVITGYGGKGPWAKKPGQDLLVQSMSGLTYLSGDRDDPPTPFGLAIVDILCGAHLVQGILAALVRKGKKNEGGLVEVSLLESALDIQFEVITTYLNDGHKSPTRAKNGSAHAYLSAPYGVYKTKDGYIAIAMEDLNGLGKKIDSEKLTEYDKEEWFSKRDEIMLILETSLKERTTEYWLSILEPADIWCSDVYNYEELLNHDGYKTLQMEQDVSLSNGDAMTTTRHPTRIDGDRLFSSKPAPKVGKHTEKINEEFNL